MFWFIAGLAIDVIAILLVIGNAVYDSVVLKNGTGHNAVINLIGFVLGIIVIIAFVLKNSGKLAGANILLWVPAVPLLVAFVVFAIYILLVMVIKPDWK